MIGGVVQTSNKQVKPVPAVISEARKDPEGTVLPGDDEVSCC